MTNAARAEHVPSAAHLVIAASITDEDAALIARVDALSAKSGGLFMVPFKALSEAQWDRIGKLNDLGYLGL